jgi:hypothetical protein
MAQTRWYKSALDDFFAPKLSDLTSCGAAEIPTPEKLIPSFLLNSIFRIQYGDHLKMHALNLIRHVDHANLSYISARACLLDYLSDSPGQRVSAYFNADSYFETHVAQLNMASWLCIRIVSPNGQLYDKGSGDWDERLQEINNQIKHLHDKILAGELSEDHTIIMWISNTGLETPTHSIAFPELIEMLGDCQKIARNVVHELPELANEAAKKKAAEKAELRAGSKQRD